MGTSKRLHKKSWIQGFLLIGIWCLTFVPVLAQGATFHTILTKDLTRLIPVTSFSKNDKIYLYTVWTGLAGGHEIKVLWIRPDKGVQETTRFKIKVPPNSQTYTSWAWLSFKKGLLDILPTEGKFIGPWKARLFLDEKFLMEYAFTVF
ncbi:MAG: hypothetical protein WA974_14435 [Thermodesulfobacteriota bacterium]